MRARGRTAHTFVKVLAISVQLSHLLAKKHILDGLPFLILTTRHGTILLLLSHVLSSERYGNI